MSNDYQDTLHWLFDLENQGIKLGLDRMRDLAQALGRPERQFRSVHIAGTNGKGSVSAMLASVLRAEGIRTGLYTSPHLVDFRERIQVDGVPITEEDVVRLASKIRKALSSADMVTGRRLTFFEVTTMLAFLYFVERKVKVAVIEVGMGGRLDATNIIDPECCVITRIGKEHTQFLGETLAEIAYEKAGIIEEGITVITAETDENALRVMDGKARDRCCPLLIQGRDFDYEVIKADLDGTRLRLPSIDRSVHLPLIGGYQASNAALACECALELDRKGIGIKETSIVAGLEQVRWPGRMEIVHHHPLVIFDVTHTAQGAEVVASELRRLVSGRLTLVLGVLEDKDLDGIASHFGPLSARAIATSPRSKRAMDPGRVMTALRRHCPEVTLEPEVSKAIEVALKNADREDTVLVTGSLYTIGEAKQWWATRLTTSDN